jgi:AraC-like DNA-binding protein/ligand-binding sensor protein
MVQKKNVYTTTHPIELSIRAIEAELGLSVTIVDNNGVFRTVDSHQKLLGHWRQSHKKNNVCAIGFCDACTDHCRHQINYQGTKEGKPFIHQCWKGVVEIVIPLIWNGTHVGSFFAGVWRTRKPISTEHMVLPEDWHVEYDRLPVIDKRRIRTLQNILSVYCLGLLQKLESLLLVGCAPGGRYAEIRKFIRYNYHKAITLKDLGHTLYLSPSRTSHLVKELFGTSFQTLLRGERIAAAKAQLIATEKTIGEIGQSVGFCDEYFFSRAFKAAEGIPPSVFRKNSRIHK